MCINIVSGNNLLIVSKIFGLGFHKTGSTTLESALIVLGYDCVGKHDHLFDSIANNDWESIDTDVNKHDAFRDMPWPLFYKELDERYPGSKFILTVRDVGSWSKSCVNHYKDIGNETFKEIYGDGKHFPLGNKDHWIRVYEEHNQAVRDYFDGREGDFLEVNWEDGDGWHELCDFLDQEVPRRQFPHANKGKYTLWDKAIRRLEWTFDREGFRKRNRDL